SRWPARRDRPASTRSSGTARTITPSPLRQANTRSLSTPRANMGPIKASASRWHWATSRGPRRSRETWRSSPPRSSTDARRRPRPRRYNEGSCVLNRRPLRRRLAIKFAKLMRWLHIYLSMFGLAMVLFFSATGVTLNHPDWFFGETQRSVQAEGQVDRHWLHK